MRNCNSIVSKNDALTVLEVIGDCLSCTTVQDAHNIMSKIGTLIDVSNAVYGLATMSQQGNIKNYKIINFSYPLEWLNLYRKDELHKQDPIALENFSSFNLKFWADTYKKYDTDKNFRRLSEDYGLVGGYAAGIINQSKTEACLLSLAGNLKSHPRHCYLINNLTPHLHRAFAGVLQETGKPESLLKISVREKQVLNWVRHGKTTWDISVILSISERTVKFHIDNVMRKLDAVSRTHAVAIALGHGLISFN